MILEISFIVLALVTLFAALKVIMTEELVHATVWLALVLVGVAGVFVTLTAEFLATVQVLVYVGAVVTLILFTVMLTIPREEPVDIGALDLPVGYSIERVEQLQQVTPLKGQAPFHGREPPRKPSREPDTYYGISKTDEEVG